MAAPTFTSMSPAVGHTAGKYLVEILGTNFELHPEPSPTGFVGSGLIPSMEVEFNGRLAEDVRVYSSSRLTCLAPSYKGDPSGISTGVQVDVLLRNLGPPVEEVTEVDAFTYKRPDMTLRESAIARVISELVLDLRRQIIDNVAVFTSVDYDSTASDGLQIVELASVPAIALFGPVLAENKERRTMERPRNRDLGTKEFLAYRHHIIEDIRFEATLVAKDDPIEEINLMAAFQLFFRDNTTLEVEKNPAQPSEGVVDLELWLTRYPEITSEPNKDNIYTATATFEIRGVPIDLAQWKLTEWGYILNDPPDVDVDYEKKEL